MKPRALEQWLKTFNELSLGVARVCLREEKKLRARHEPKCDALASAIYQCWKEFDAALAKRIEDIDSGKYAQEVENAVRRLKSS